MKNTVEMSFQTQCKQHFYDITLTLPLGSDTLILGVNLIIF